MTPACLDKHDSLQGIPTADVNVGAGTGYGAPQQQQQQQQAGYGAPGRPNKQQAQQAQPQQQYSGYGSQGACLYQEVSSLVPRWFGIIQSPCNCMVMTSAVFMQAVLFCTDSQTAYFWILESLCDGCRTAVQGAAATGA